MKLVDFLKGLWDSEKAEVDSAGQRVVSFDAILPDVEGLEILDKNNITGGETVEDIPLNDGGGEVAESTPSPTWATEDQLSELLERIVKLEGLITAVDSITNIDEGGLTEQW